jgi:hypothetical protein
MEEIFVSIGRLEIETTSFYLEFVVPPSEEKMKRIINKRAFSNLEVDHYQGKINLKEFAYGPYLARELIRNFRDKICDKKFIFISIIVSIILRGVYSVYYKITFNNGV